MKVVFGQVGILVGGRGKPGGWVLGTGGFFKLLTFDKASGVGVKTIMEEKGRSWINHTSFTNTGA